MTEDFFSGGIDYIEKTIISRNEKLAMQPDAYKKPEIFKWANFRGRYQQILLSYSAGNDFGEIAERFPSVIFAYEEYLRCRVHENTSFNNFDSYVVSLWLVSFALLFDVDAALFDRLLKCIGNEGRDKLFERLVATRISGRPVATGLMFPKVYEPLYNAIDAAEPERSKLIGQFLKNWYQNMKPTYWYDCHKGPKGGGFFGYWATEAAGVIKAFGIDDSAFRNLPYYPKDLV